MTIKFTFVSLGSVGDVAPLVAVARELQARGHSCRLLANEDFVAGARSAGLDAAAVAPRMEILHHVLRFDEYLYCAHANIAEQLAAQGPAGLIVNCDRYCASNLVAERRGLRVARVHLSPFKLRPYDTARTPSYELFARNPRVLSFVNQLRGSFGLGDVTTAFHQEPYVVRHVATFPDWFCPEPPSSAPALDFVGFPLAPEHVPLPDELRAFIDSRGRPLVFTFGSANDQLDDFIEQAERCCKELRLPGVVLCPRGVGARRSSARLLLCPFVPLGAVLPEARLLVHHGGVGTTARALEASVPQVIIPQRFDQPDNGARCVALGVGAVLDPTRASPRLLLQAIRGLLDSAAVSRRAVCLSERTRRGRGLERFADSLEAAAATALAPSEGRGASAARAEAAIAG